MLNYFKKPIQNILFKELKPVTRLFTDGFSQMGAIHRQADTRTMKELTQTLDYYAQKIPEIQQFVKEIKDLKPKDIGLIVDSLELSSNHALLTSNEANLDRAFSQTVREKLIPQMIKASKENPQAMDLVGSIINNTDSITSKYVLHALSGGILNKKEFASHMEETSKIIDKVASETLNGGYRMDFSKQENFLQFIRSFINKETVPEKISFLFEELIKVTDSIKGVFEVNVPKFVRSKVPLDNVRENLKILSQLSENGLKPESTDLVEFVIKNVNIK